MLDQKAKKLFISILEFKIDWFKQDDDHYEKGVVDSLADVLEKTKSGLYDWYFDYSYEPNDDDASIRENTQRWRARQKQIDTNYEKRLEYMTEDEYALCREDYRSSALYFNGRVRGYDMAGQMIGLITT